MDWHPIQGGVEVLVAASCYRNRDKLRLNGPLGLRKMFFILGGLSDLFVMIEHEPPAKSKACDGVMVNSGVGGYTCF